MGPDKARALDWLRVAFHHFFKHMQTPSTSSSSSSNDRQVRGKRSDFRYINPEAATRKNDQKRVKNKGNKRGGGQEALNAAVHTAVTQSNGDRDALKEATKQLEEAEKVIQTLEKENEKISSVIKCRDLQPLSFSWWQVSEHAALKVHRNNAEPVRSAEDIKCLILSLCLSLVLFGVGWFCPYLFFFFMISVYFNYRFLKCRSQVSRPVFGSKVIRYNLRSILNKECTHLDERYQAVSHGRLIYNNPEYTEVRLMRETHYLTREGRLIREPFLKNGVLVDRIIKTKIAGVYTISREAVSQLTAPSNLNFKSSEDVVYDRLCYQAGSLTCVSIDRRLWEQSLPVSQDSALVAFWHFKSLRQDRWHSDFPRTPAT